MRKCGGTGRKMSASLLAGRHIFDSGTHAWLEWQAKGGGATCLTQRLTICQRERRRSVPRHTSRCMPTTGRTNIAPTAASSVAPSAKVATGIYVPARAASTLTKPALAGVDQNRCDSPESLRLNDHLSSRRRSVRCFATPRPQHLQPNAQRAVSTARRSSPNVEGVSKTLATTSKAKSVVSTHRKSAVAGKRLLAQKGHGRHRRHVVSKTARHRHVRGPSSHKMRDM